MGTHQATNQPVNIRIWRRDEEFEPYPEGARDKTRVEQQTPNGCHEMVQGNDVAVLLSFRIGVSVPTPTWSRGEVSSDIAARGNTAC